MIKSGQIGTVCRLGTMLSNGGWVDCEFWKEAYEGLRVRFEGREKGVLSEWEEKDFRLALRRMKM